MIQKYSSTGTVTTTELALHVSYAKSLTVRDSETRFVPDDVIQMADEISHNLVAPRVLNIASNCGHIGAGHYMVVAIFARQQASTGRYTIPTPA